MLGTCAHLLLQSAVRQWLSTLGTPILFLLLLAAAAAGAYTLERIVITVLRSYARRTKARLDDVIVRAVHPSLMIAVFIGTVWLALRFLRLPFSDLTYAIINNVGATLVIVAVGVAIVRLATGLLSLPAQRNPRWYPLSTVGARLAAATLWVFIALAVLHQYGIEITPVIATLGVAGIAVGLALQSTLQNFFAGLWIQTGENLRPGHFIRLENQKVEGFIEEVGWRATRVRTLPGNMVIVPNHEMSTAIITNYSLPAEKMGTSITLVTGFEADPDRVVEILLEEARAMAKEVDYVVEDPAPAARLNRRHEHGWEFWCGFWVAHFWDQWNAQGQLFRRIRARFLQEGIRLALPIQEEFRVPEDRVDIAHSIVSAPAVRANGGPSTTRSSTQTEHLPSEGEA